MRSDPPYPWNRTSRHSWRPLRSPSRPSFKHVGGVQIKLAAIFASWSGIGSHPFVEPLPYGSRFHPQPTSNLLRRQSLLTQGQHLLIALLSLGTPRGNGLLHAFFLDRTPFLNRQEAVSWRLRRSFCSLAGRFHLEEDMTLIRFRRAFNGLELRGWKTFLHPVPFAFLFYHNKRHTSNISFC